MGANAMMAPSKKLQEQLLARNVAGVEEKPTPLGIVCVFINCWQWVIASLMPCFQPGRNQRSNHMHKGGVVGG